jgi:glucokinase
MNNGAEAAVVLPATEQEQVRTHPRTHTLDWTGVLAQQGYVFGVDITGNGERVALADVRGTVMGSTSSTRKGDSDTPVTPNEVVERVCEMMRGLLKEGGIKPREVLRAAVGFGGPVDARHGRVRLSHDSRGWEGFPVAVEIERQLDVPTYLENDARLAAMGEVWFGAGHGTSECDMVYLHWSTGVGGGVVNEGKLLRGASTTAGEFGHTTVRTGADALPCRCGGRGHLEAYVRGPALLSRARDVLASEGGMGITPPADLETLFAGAGTSTALGALVDESVDMMAVTISNLITSFNPSLVVIGGRVAQDAAHLIPRIADRARGYAMPVSAQGVEIVPTVLGDEATLLGAVALALDSLR